MLVSYCYYRLPNLACWLVCPLFLTLPRWALTLTHFLAKLTFQSSSLATICMLLNRLTAISWPVKHRKVSQNEEIRMGRYFRHFISQIIFSNLGRISNFNVFKLIKIDQQKIIFSLQKNLIKNTIIGG